MRRLNVVIADTDKAYVDNMVSYLMTNHSERFQVSSFTKQEFLYDFLSGLKKVDVLLISTDMYNESLPKENVTSVVLLTQGKLSAKFHGLNFINKYQHGEKIASDIVDMYPEKADNSDSPYNSECSHNTFVEPEKHKNTKVVAIYSPLGGVGKTTIAVSSSIYCGQKGLNVFYLNLESFHSTPLFFHCKGEKNLSQIINHVTDKKDNLSLKIEESRQIDPDYNVHYFCPPESILDIEEADPEDLKELINGFKSMDYYDVVIVDMSNDLNKRNMALLEACDEVVLVLAQDAVSNVKAESISKQLKLLLERKKLDLSGKLTVALNKYNFHMALEVDTASINDEFISIYIPAVPGMTAIKGNTQLMDMQGEFGASIKELMDKYICAE